MREKIGAVAYLECSAKTGDGVEEILNVIAPYILSKDVKTPGKEDRRSFRSLFF